MPPRRLRSRLRAWALPSRAESGRLRGSRATIGRPRHSRARLGRLLHFRATIGRPTDCRARSVRSEAQNWREVARNPSGVQMLPENASDVRMPPDNHPASTHYPATPSAPEQSYLKRKRGTNVHASFGNIFFAHRQTPRHQRSKTPGLHEGIMRLPAPGQKDIPTTGTSASQASRALEDCPPPDRHIGTYS